MGAIRGMRASGLDMNYGWVRYGPIHDGIWQASGMGWQYAYASGEPYNVACPYCGATCYVGDGDLLCKSCGKRVVDLGDGL